VQCGVSKWLKLKILYSTHKYVGCRCFFPSGLSWIKSHWTVYCMSYILILYHSWVMVCQSCDYTVLAGANSFVCQPNVAGVNAVKICVVSLNFIDDCWCFCLVMLKSVWQNHVVQLLVESCICTHTMSTMHDFRRFILCSMHLYMLFSSVFPI